MSVVPLKNPMAKYDGIGDGEVGAVVISLGDDETRRFVFDVSSWSASLFKESFGVRMSYGS